VPDIAAPCASIIYWEILTDHSDFINALSKHSHNKKQIYVLIENKIFLQSIREVLFENNFHKLPIFSDGQIDFFWEFLCKPYLEFKNLAIRNSIELLNQLLDKKFNREMNSLYSHIDVNKENFEDRELLNKLNEYRCNLIEDYLSKYEEKWGVIFNKIKNVDFKRLDYQDYEDLCIFCGFTLCRTKYMRNKQFKIIKDLCTKNGIFKLKDRELEDLILLLLTFIIPLQLSNVFVNEKIIFTVIHNETDLNLITNDNPVRNIRYHDDSIEFIIPISTRILLKCETIKNPEMVSYLNDQFENDVNIMQDWVQFNQNIDTPLSVFPKSTGKSIYNLLLFESKWDDPDKINGINNYMNEQKNLYVIGSKKEDLEPFKQQP